MSNQLVITSGAKVRSLEGVLTGTAGVVSSVPYGGANGVATLDGSGKVPLSQLPASVITYLGTWNASTNTPTLTNGVGDVGDLYICNVAGTVNFGAGPITFAVGDWVIYSGTTWEKSGGASGTVTSVAMTTPTGLSVTGSPITTSGTLALSLSSGYTIPTTSFLSGLVPYTGATNDVDLGTHSLSADYLEVSTTSTQTADVAQIVWNASDGTFDMGLLNDVTLQAGQEMHIYGKAQGTISNGQAVMFAGSQGDHLLIAKANAETINAYPQYFIGVATQDFANNEFGYVTVFGKVRNIDTTAYPLGSVLYYDSTSATDGLLTSTMPVAPNAKIVVAAVVRVHATQGILMVRPHPMPKLSDIQDVGISDVANTDGIFYNSSTSVWENKTIAEVLGYTPANAADYVPYTGATSSLNLGNYGLTAASMVVASTGTNAGQIQLKQGSTFSQPSGYGSIGSGTVNDFYLYQNVSSVIRGARLSLASITGGATRTYTLPDADGTIALTSNLSGYVQGSGTTSYISKWTASGTIGNSMLTDDGTTLQSIGATRSNLYLRAASSSYYSQLAFTNGSNGSFGGISYNNSGQYMQFETNGSEWVRLTSDGKLGIGTTSPLSQLQVVGTGTAFRIGESSGTTGKQLLFSIDSSDGHSEIASIWQGTSATSLCLNPTGGNVGIGTSSPTSIGGYTALTINNNSNGSFIDLNNSGTNNARFLSLPAGDFRIYSTSSIAFYTSSSERMRLTNTGLGIGKTSPNYSLDVNGNIAASSTLYANGSGAQLQIGGVGSGVLSGVFQGFNSNMLFIGDWNTATKGIYIDVGTGNVGIGVGNPSYKLQVYGGNGTYLIGGTSNSSGYAIIIQNSSNNNLILARNDGLISFPKTASDWTTGNAANAWINPSGGDLYRSTSSIKYKKNVQDYNKGLAEVMQLRPVSYEGIGKIDSNKTFAGLIAEEVHDLGLTEFVQYAEDKTPDALAYQNMVALLTKAIQEQQAQIEELKAKLN